MADPTTPAAPVEVRFDAHPSRYRHWKLHVEGDTARLSMSVDNQAAAREGYDLKLNSYDLAVDIELADAVERLRFEHPAVKVVVISSDRERVFCAGANIFMLQSSGHPFKVNFCKYTNETRLAIEDASAHSGQRYLAALNGTCAGGGYELALACDEILLIDDGAATVSLPEVPLLGVLPGTGGLTRLVDKRKVRRDLADVFSTLAEGLKGKRAVEWRLVDGVAPRSKFAEATATRARALAGGVTVEKKGPGVLLPPLEVQSVGEGAWRWRHVELRVDRARRVAELTLHAPDAPQPSTSATIAEVGAAWWPLQMSRELDEALLRLRFHHEDVGLVLLRTRGDAQRVLAVDATLAELRSQSWFVAEVVLHLARTLRRLDLTGRAFFAVADEGSCFAGTLLEVALAADRIYLLDDPKRPVTLATSAMNAGPLPTPAGISRLSTRYLADPTEVGRILAHSGPFDVDAARQAGLATVVADEIDFDEELRVAVEERVSLSPDALTGMEASLRFAGPETMATKIFGRLSAWQNWIFTRPNATGPTGALTLYGRPERPTFDWRRT